MQVSALWYDPTALDADAQLARSLAHLGGTARLVFLDVDGVLNSRQSRGERPGEY